MLEKFEKYKIENPNCIFGGNGQNTASVGAQDVQSLGAITIAI